MKTFVAASNIARSYLTDVGINCTGKWILEMWFDVVPWVRMGQLELDIWIYEYGSGYLDLIASGKCPRYANHMSTSPARLCITGLITMRVVTIQFYPSVTIRGKLLNCVNREMIKAFFSHFRPIWAVNISRVTLKIYREKNLVASAPYKPKQFTVCYVGYNGRPRLACGW